LHRSAVRLVAPTLLACVAAASAWVPAAGASTTSRLATHAAPPKKHKRTTVVRKRSTPAKSTHRTSSRPVEPELPPLPPMIATLPTLEDLLSGRSAATLTEGDSASSTLAVRSARVGPLAAFSASASRLLESMVDRARSQLGTRYVFGGERPGEGLDCSSFARFAMEAMGIKLPRTAAQQARLGNAVPRDRSKLLPGDLLTFGRGKSVSHVGIYLGEGRFIHASVASRKIIETTIDRNPRLFRRWQGARRLIAIDDSTKHGES
jgi:cell wall-associated NlpC family hydrolase